MEEWYSKVRRLKDESEDKNKTEQFVTKVFHDLSRMKIKEKVKFKQRMGPEFENWVLHFGESYSSEFISEILGDDEFWDLTLKLTRGL
jgi:hypothetical protein